ncbi:MAG: SUMF1/EgtB/PvdO family nonheme iron enzyme [Kiritimatiellae bacterium]|nr:SUMF1/EgtB/PvdO family nonheme iron enzyme [Kiritimatiellia bacterium]
MKHITSLICLLACTVGAAVEITSVSAKQRWPWNNLVDVDFVVDAPAGDFYRVVIDAKSASGGKTFAASTYVSDPVAQKGSNRVTWDFGADYPDVRVDDLKFTVSLAPYSEAMPLYLKIDLSGGPDAAKYPVKYTFSPPQHVMGAADEPCQTTELWLRRIRHYEGAMPFHRFSYTDKIDNNFYGKITKDYYIGIFELTQRQFELVAGYNPSFFSNQTCYASRPVERIYGDYLYGCNCNIQKHPEKVSADSFFGKLRAKTGLPLEVPSAMQFEYASRGGYYTGEYYSYKVKDDDGALRETTYAEIGRWSQNSDADPTGDSGLTGGTAAVGSYLPNMFGLYDTMGNVWELTCEYVKDYNNRAMSIDLAILREKANDDTLGRTPENPVIDYNGQDKSSSCWRTMGGGFNKASVTLWNEGWHMYQVYLNSTKDARLNFVGTRISMTVK